MGAREELLRQRICRPEIAARASGKYLAAREDGDKRLVLDHATSDVAANLMIAAKAAVESYAGLRNNTNTSNTALAQSQVAGTVTQGNLTAAMAQLMAYQAAKEAAQDYEREIARRQELARWVETHQRAEIAFAAQQAGLDARRDTLREGLLFRIPALYGGLAARGGSTFSELRWYPRVEAAKGSLSWVFRTKQPESVRTGP